MRRDACWSGLGMRAKTSHGRWACSSVSGARAEGAQQQNAEAMEWAILSLGARQHAEPNFGRLWRRRGWAQILTSSAWKIAAKLAQPAGTLRRPSDEVGIMPSDGTVDYRSR